MKFHDFREQFLKSYAAGGDAYQRPQDDGRLHAVRVMITVLGAVFYVILEHYTTWSHVLQIAVAVAATILAQYLAHRFFERLPPKVDRS